MKSPSNFKNITGETFGRLTVIERRGSNKDWKPMWLCRCECGNEGVFQGKLLKNGTTKSCGCLREELRGSLNRTHGKSGTSEYNTWCRMVARCENKESSDFSDYGGRGIKVCLRWRNSFSSFIADMGSKPSPLFSIGRINNDGNYEPGNCRWETASQQASNRRSSRMLECNGVSKTITQWSRETGISRRVISYRINKIGWSVFDALHAPRKVIA